MTSATGGLQVLSSEHRLELLIASVADYAIYMLDANGYVATWNTGAERIKGWRAGEIIGRHFSTLFTPGDRAQGVPAAILAAALEHGRHESEGQRPRKDGSRFWASAVIQCVRDTDGNLVGFAEITRDITEQRAARQALQESERHFRLLVEGVTDYAIYMLDRNGVVVSWNAGAERLKGYSAREAIGRHFSTFYTVEDRAAGLPARVLEAATREGRCESEGWRVRKDGGRFWASAVVDAIRGEDGRLEGFAKVTRDITERRAAQEALRESERQFRLLVSNVVDYAICMLDPNGIVTSWNAGAERIKGYAAHEIIGQHFSRFYTEADRAAGLPLRTLNAAASEGHFEAEAWRLRKDGTLFWANVVIAPVRDEERRLVGFAKITRDVTERRTSQLALQDAQAQRAHAQKMDALGQLTGGVAHDFNNLLMVVLGQVDLLRRRGLADAARVENALAAIEMAGQRGAALTHQLLSFARRQSVNPVALEPAQQIASFAVMLRTALGSSARLEIEVPQDCWRIKVDPGELELALLNLALNARDAMPEGGVVTVSAENVTLAGTETPAGLTGPFVALSVADTGAGIPPDVMDRVFDPFFTTKGEGRGTGLGLSQVHGFAHQSGGTVTLASELGSGTTVTLWLPRTGEEESAAAEPGGELEPAPGGRVLLVEDNPDVGRVTAEMLEQLGYAVRQVSDGDAALAAVDGESAAFDLVVSDIVMPGGKDGVALARALRERRPGLPVLLVTGYSEMAARAAGEFTVLRKPFLLAELSRAAARMIADSGEPAGANVVRLRDVRRD